ncbi:MAG: CinA family protein [Flavisolibacter sp.]
MPQLISADIHIAITGLTTPGGSETPEKPVGTMFIHMIFQNRSFKEQKLFRGDAEKIVLQTVETVAEMILRSFGK